MAIQQDVDLLVSQYNEMGEAGVPRLPDEWMGSVVVICYSLPDDLNWEIYTEGFFEWMGINQSLSGRRRPLEGFLISFH